MNEPLESDLRPEHSGLRALAACAAFVVIILAFVASCGASPSNRGECTRPPDRGADMHNCDLSHQVLAHQILPDINFANANLTGTDFRDDNLRRADMTRVKASGGLFDRAKLRSVYAPFGDFSHATMTETNLDFSEMTDAKLDGVDLRRGTLHGANLRGASLRGANLSSRITERAQGTPLVTDRVDLTDTNLEVADLTGADLTGALTTGWNILNARFDHTTCPDGTVVTKGATTPGTC